MAGCPGTPVNNVHYEVHNFALDANGTVDISLPSPSTKLALYSGTFDPANPFVRISLQQLHKAGLVPWLRVSITFL